MGLKFKLLPSKLLGLKPNLQANSRAFFQIAASFLDTPQHPWKLHHKSKAQVPSDHHPSYPFIIDQCTHHCPLPLVAPPTPFQAQIHLSLSCFCSNSQGSPPPDLRFLATPPAYLPRNSQVCSHCFTHTWPEMSLTAHYSVTKINPPVLPGQRQKISPPWHLYKL